MNRLLFSAFLLVTLFSSVMSCTPTKNKIIPQKTTFKIAFGSCGQETEPLPVFNEIVRQNPDLFIFLGDNIYGDTYEMDTLRAKYERLASKPSFQNLKNNVELIATWDDHDFGWNDAGRHYPFKEESKEIFLDFFNEPATSERRTREGIYQSYFYEVGNKKLQIIMLDMRTFRDDLKKYDGKFDHDKRYFYSLDYTPHTTHDSTLLGETQWQWLETELRKEADIRIVGSSTQFAIEYNGYEAWANFPHEQQRFLDLIKQTKANGVVVISGDVHYAEISSIENTNSYPIYDVTSSGLSSTWHFPTPNINRVEGPVMENHFGMLTIENTEEATSIKAEIFDLKGNQRIEYTIPLEELTLREAAK